MWGRKPGDFRASRFATPRADSNSGHTNERHLTFSQETDVSPLTRQLPITISVAVSALLTFVLTPQVFNDNFFFVGVIVIFVAAGVASLEPVSPSPKLLILLPMSDILGIALMSSHDGGSVYTLLFFIPISWMSSLASFRASMLLAASPLVFLVSLAWAHGKPLNQAEITNFALVSAVLIVVASVSNQSAKKVNARNVLMRGQLELLDEVLLRERRQQELLDVVLNSVDVAILRVDKTGKTIFSNAAHRRLVNHFGVIPEMEVPPQLFKSDGVTEYETDERPYHRALSGDRLEREVAWIGDGTKPQMAILLNVLGFVDENSNPDGGIVVATDITDEMTSIQSREDLMTSISHEIRNPLTAVLGFLDLALDDDTLSAGTRKQLEIATFNSERIMKLIEGLLVRVEDDRRLGLAKLDWHNLSEVLIHAVEDIAPSAAQRNIDIELADVDPLFMKVDPIRIRQVFDNLLSNAVKYNKDNGSIRVTVNVTRPTQSAGQVPTSSVEVRVTDSGMGIAEAEQVNLFKRFYRAKSVRGTSIHGTGLGLSISREIMRLHGGDLHLESVGGRGTSAVCRFQVTNPSANLFTKMPTA